jgi:hypothetical protein
MVIFHSFLYVYQGVKTPFFFILVGSIFAGNPKTAPSSRFHGSEGLPQVAAQALPRTAQLVLKLCLDRAGAPGEKCWNNCERFLKGVFCKISGNLAKKYKANQTT